MSEAIFFKMNLKNMPEVTMANEANISAPNQHFKRKPSEYILYLVKDGEMLLQEGDVKYHLCKGDMILLDPSRCHFGHRLDSPVRYFYAHFWVDGMEELSYTQEQYEELLIDTRYKMSVCNDSNQEVPFLIPKYCQLDEVCFSKMEFFTLEMERSLHNGIGFSGNLAGCQLQALLIEIYNQLSNQLFLQADSNTQTTIQMIAYLKQQFSGKITSEMIEEAFHGNFDYMNRKFKKNTGKTIFQYLNEYRVQESMRLLKSGVYSQGEIAEKTGFCNEYYYSKVFKKCVGVSPSVYKKRL